MALGRFHRAVYPWLVRHLSFYPPYIGAGVRVKARLDENAYRVELPLSWFNRNIFGTHFGGTLFSMCDPFFALVIQHRLGDDYEVWMKRGAIDYVRPGVGTVGAEFHVPESRVEEIRRRVDAEGKTDEEFSVEVLDRQQRVVARVEQVIHVRRAAR